MFNGFKKKNKIICVKVLASRKEVVNIGVTTINVIFSDLYTMTTKVYGYTHQRRNEAEYPGQETIIAGVTLINKVWRSASVEPMRIFDSLGQAKDYLSQCPTEQSTRIVDDVKNPSKARIGTPVEFTLGQTEEFHEEIDVYYLIDKTIEL